MACTEYNITVELLVMVTLYRYILYNVSFLKIKYILG